MKSFALIGALSAVGVAAGCVAEDDGTAAWSAPILYGTEDTAAAHAGIVRLWIEETTGDKWGCTGTFIAPRVVLTAAHCLEGEVVAVTVGVGPDEDTADWYDASSWQLHPDFGFVPGTGVYVNDIALVRLASEPAGIELIAPLPPAQAVTAGEVGNTDLQYVGYGLTETGDSGLRRTVTVKLAFLCAGSASCTWWWDLFHYAIVAPGNLCHRKDPGGTCSGDSGGPVIVRRGGTEYVAGVISWSNSGCESLGCATKVDAFADFLAEASEPPPPDECDAGDCGEAPDAGAPIDAPPDSGPSGHDEPDAGTPPCSEGDCAPDAGYDADGSASSAGCRVASNGGGALWLPLMALLVLARRRARRDR